MARFRLFARIHLLAAKKVDVLLDVPVSAPRLSADCAQLATLALRRNPIKMIDNVVGQRFMRSTQPAQEAFSFKAPPHRFILIEPIYQNPER